MLEPDRNQLEIFVDALFRHAGDKGFVTVRSFYEGADQTLPIQYRKPFGRVASFSSTYAEDDARRAAQNPKPVVFCPPLAVFGNKDHAREQDLLEGLALSVELDEHPRRGAHDAGKPARPSNRCRPSGGTWVNGGQRRKTSCTCIGG